MPKTAEHLLLDDNSLAKYFGLSCS